MKNVYLLIFVSVFFITQTFSQTFTPLDASFLNVTFSQASWADVDGDGDLDALVFGMTDAGTYETALYRNKGNDVFEEITDAGLENLAIGSHSWGDYDNDGDVDLLIQGINGTTYMATTILYKNNGDGTFTDAGAGLHQVYMGTVRMVDFNNDGYLDIFACGFDDNTYVTNVYTNNGDGTFTESPDISLPGVQYSTIEFADYDKDNDMDFIFMGSDINANFITKLYRNNGDGTFEDAGVSFPQAWLGDAAWGDYNMDGYPDLVISGFVYPGRITNLYKNNGDGTFTQIDDTPFEKVSHSALEWGDYDNDGDLDLFLAGQEENADGSWSYYTKIYNNNEGTFTESNIEFPPIYWGDAAWGDYNNDGRLDLIQTGYDENGLAKTVVYRNDAKGSNTPPQPPVNLSAEVNGNTVTLSWDAGSDAETETEGLTYNAYLYNLDTGDTIWSSMADIATGYRLVLALGNVTQNKSWIIKDLNDGTYGWSVQTIDNCFAGSEFAPVNTFMVDITGISKPDAETVSLYPNPAKDMITLESGQKLKKVTLFNSTGQQVLAQPLNTTQYNLNISGLPAGIYLINIETGNKVITQKIVKE